MTQADVTNLSFLSVDSFAPGSNIIVSASGSDWSAEFPVGLKLEFFTGKIPESYIHLFVMLG